MKVTKIREEYCLKYPHFNPRSHMCIKGVEELREICLRCKALWQLSGNRGKETEKEGTGVPAILLIGAVAVAAAAALIILDSMGTVEIV